MKLNLSRRPSPAMVVATIALCFALVGTAVAQTDAVSRALTKAKVKSIAKKQANKQITARAPGLSVAKAASADTATNADALGGRSLAQVRSAAAGQNNAAVQALSDTAEDVATASIDVAAPSRLLVNGSVELSGATDDERAVCNLTRNGGVFSVTFETTFDDINADNEATLSVTGTAANVPAGTHTIAISCTEDVGTVVKDDAGLTVLAVPNP